MEKQEEDNSAPAEETEEAETESQEVSSEE